jgi:hypothetical protein
MGVTGQTGATGEPGAPGAVAPMSSDHLHERAVIQDQITRILHELEVQLKRIAQLQAEMDTVRATLQQLRVTPPSPQTGRVTVRDEHYTPFKGPQSPEQPRL